MVSIQLPGKLSRQAREGCEVRGLGSSSTWAGRVGDDKSHGEEAKRALVEDVEGSEETTELPLGACPWWHTHS